MGTCCTICQVRDVSQNQLCERDQRVTSGQRGPHSKRVIENEETHGDNKKKYEPCSRLWPVFIAVLLVGLVLLSVGIFLITLGYLTTVRDYVILGSCGIFSGLCFIFVCVYRMFKSLHSTFMDQDYKSFQDTTENVCKTTEDSFLTTNIDNDVSWKLGSDESFSPSIFKKKSNTKQRADGRRVFFNTNANCEEEKEILEDSNECLPIGQQLTSAFKRDYATIRAKEETKVKTGKEHETSSLVSNTLSSYSSSTHNNNAAETKSLQNEINNKHQSLNIASLNNQTSKRGLNRNHQLKVVIENNDPKVFPTSNRSVTDSPLLKSDYLTNKPAIMQPVETTVEICVHHICSSNMFDSGQSSIDSLTMLTHEENIFLQDFADIVAPPVEFSDDLQSSLTNTVSWELSQQTHQKFICVDINNKQKSPLSELKPPYVGLIGVSPFDDNIEVLSD